jgi:hypothetical protein
VFVTRGRVRGSGTENSSDRDLFKKDKGERIKDFLKDKGERIRDKVGKDKG